MEKFKQISPLEHVFLKRLCFLEKPPKKLYYYGNLPEVFSENGDENASWSIPDIVPATEFSRRFPFEGERRPKCVTVVGSRRNSIYGEEQAYRIAYDLASMGIVIISGLAYGIDSIAHRAALDAGGVTVAVLGSRINDIYPHDHLELAREIVEKGGAVVSEYGPEYKFEDPKRAFLERNRLSVGMSDAVVVVEAAKHSGTLNSAHHALATGVPLFSVPGDIGRPTTGGSNHLFMEGASVFQSIDDILQEIFMDPDKILALKNKEAKSERIKNGVDRN